jgi:hypothetical protein
MYKGVTFSHPPYVSLPVATTELEEPETTDRSVPKNSTDDRANQILQCDVLVAGALGTRFPSQAF